MNLLDRGELVTVEAFGILLRNVRRAQVALADLRFGSRTARVAYRLETGGIEYVAKEIHVVVHGVVHTHLASHYSGIRKVDTQGKRVTLF